MSAPSARPRSWLREPLLHFFVAGAVMFAAHARLRQPPVEAITVSAEFVDGLRATHAKQTGRAPTDEEARGLVERYVEEEILYREALALGLDKGDVIVRRRLAQKMQFVLESEAAAIEPSTAELQAYLDAHPDRYRSPATISFRHVFVSRDRHGERTNAEAARLLAELNAGADAGGLGDPFLQGNAWSRRAARDLEATFGAGFAEGVFAAKEGAWAGPIASSYGAHLVFVSERAEGSVPPLTAVLARVRDDVRAGRRSEALRAATARLRERYRVVFEGGGAP